MLQFSAQMCSTHASSALAKQAGVVIAGAFRSDVSPVAAGAPTSGASVSVCTALLLTAVSEAALRSDLGRQFPPTR